MVSRSNALISHFLTTAPILLPRTTAYIGLRRLCILGSRLTEVFPFEGGYPWRFSFDNFNISMPGFRAPNKPVRVIGFHILDSIQHSHKFCEIISRMPWSSPPALAFGRRFICFTFRGPLMIGSSWHQLEHSFGSLVGGHGSNTNAYSIFNRTAETNTDIYSRK